jgi:hypothetical protein
MPYCEACKVDTYGRKGGLTECRLCQKQVCAMCMVGILCSPCQAHVVDRAAQGDAIIEIPPERLRDSRA